ncbi:hypothetical protein SAMN02745176_01497 [Lutispora thermophila DSM 19022]|uniref:Uncharacterized protein n=1 Tax=Lutispora thermophila DSM 19022 TaxID=1122184 RepID=A0A1M6E8Z7_9FIRM|nr:hypothetical protein SAMN02745176_01497 [Lutispora thermophila DSM 19022]
MSNYILITLVMTENANINREHNSCYFDIVNKLTIVWRTCYANTN